MTPVKIASRVTAQGVDGGRWVLVDEQQGADAEGSSAASSRPSSALTGRPVMAHGLKAVALVAGLAAALWTSGPGQDDPPLGLLQPLAIPQLPAAPWSGAANDRAPDAATGAAGALLPAPAAVVTPAAGTVRARPSPPVPAVVADPPPVAPAASTPAGSPGLSMLTAVL